MRRRTFVANTITGGISVASSSGWALGAYPDQPITLVVAAPAGGGTELIARLYADQLSRNFGQQVVVDNKGGGNGNIATALGARAKPDGYTLLMQYSAYHSANPAMMKDLNWRPADLAGVPMGAIAPQVIVIPKQVPEDDFGSVIAYAKANPGKLNYASFGPGSVAHIGGVMLTRGAGIELVHVPYKGAGPLTSDIVAEQVELAIMSPPSVAGHIRNGNLKALVLASNERHPAFPDIPSTAEAGLPGFILDAWFAIFAPSSTPRPIVDKLNAAMRTVVKMDGTRERANQLGTVLKDSSPGEFDKFVRDVGEVWSKLIRDNNITMAE